ncbi:hypothetical protein POTOM_044736 [Populus tomentosa]|uniref:non-specific serine/threonine protein kinase n=1 Tax=Populus tomentosa TaxID=118781 RepID=A0A8X7YFZ8_POPTO|nr:hypothetical protein POTOM_044736 [Populus tomentosa]
MFSFGIGTTGGPQFLIWKDNDPYSRSDVYINSVSFAKLSKLRPFAYYLTLNLKGDDIYVTYSASENSAILRVTLVPDGRIELLLWQEINNDWLSMWQWPSTYCEFYAQCSPFSSCDPKGSQDHCKCLPGFQPKVQQEWDTRNWTGGTCVRQKALRCDKDDGFLELVNMKLPDHSYILGNMSTNDCESRCLQNCSCTAYAYLNASDGASGKCLNWYGDLMDLVQDFVGSDLYIRLHDGDPVGNVKSSVKFTRKNKRSIIIAVAAVSIGFVCVLSGYFIWRKSIGKQERIEETCTGMNTSIELGKNPYEKANLDWSKRFRIIEGIAQGLLYIHKYSRLKVIHRDLKASNILLDEAMNPKISDFGMARMFGSDQTEADTKRVVGTYGYMSPEYALYGKFSEKSDVFSFGVLLLELVTGKRNSEFFGSELPLTLQGWAWEMWNDDRGLDLIDLSIRDTSECPERALKCINVGLLCVQESPVDRPAMPLVVLMLGNDNASLPSPEEPAFSSIKRRKSSNVASSSSSDHNTLSSCSNNELTITLPQAR